MSQESRFSDELGTYVSRDEADALDRVAERLEVERPLPRPGFRAALRARISDTRTPWHPRRLGLTVAAYVFSGFALLATAAIGLTGAGPLGY